MIKHIVMWNFKEDYEGNDKETNISHAIKILHTLTEKCIDEKGEKIIHSLETGINFNDNPAAGDLVLITTHKDKKGLQNYQQHPEHQKVAQFIGGAASDRKVVDFEY